MLDDAHGKSAELQFLKHLGKSVHIGRLAAQFLLVPLYWHIGLDSGEEL